MYCGYAGTITATEGEMYLHEIIHDIEIIHAFAWLATGTAIGVLISLIVLWKGDGDDK